MKVYFGDKLVAEAPAAELKSVEGNPVRARARGGERGAVLTAARSTSRSRRS